MTAETVCQPSMIGMQSFLPNRMYSLIIQENICILRVKDPGSFSALMQKDLGFETHLEKDPVLANASNFAKQPGGLENSLFLVKC